MNSFLYILAIVFVLAGLFGLMSYSASGLIYMLFALALVAVLMRLIEGRKSEY